MRDPIFGSIATILLLAAPICGGGTYVVDQRMPAAADSNPGSEQAPWKTIARAAATAQAGDTVLIRTGVYREAVVLKRSGTADQPIRFLADAASSVIVTGADRLTDWKKGAEDTGLFSAPWSHSFINWSPNHTHPDDVRHRLIGRCEQVFVQGYALRQVPAREKLSPGTFFVDLEAKRLYAWAAAGDDLSNRDIITESSARDVIWDCRGDHVQTRGITFRYAANHAQQGAAIFSGGHDTVEDCTFERTNGVGATFEAPDIVVRNCTFQQNGQLGFGANRAHRLLLTGCLIRGNNIKGFDRDWEAGGNKLVLSRGVVLESSRFVENRGHGIWFDIGNEGCTVRNCLISDNEDAGIFYEISFGLHAHDNVITGNGLAGTPGAWGASSGISVSSSPGCVIERNLLIGNKEGFSFREAERRTPRIDGPRGAAEEPVWNHDEVIRHNVIAYNRDAQTWGWFDVNDERQWPTAMQQQSATSRPLSLDSLKLSFTGNYYALRGAEGLFDWGVPWKRHQKYSTLDDVRRELRLEQDSIMGAFAVGRDSARDYRISADSPAALARCYPQGDVPGVKLGTLTR
jgi:hypothetical protein